MIETFYENGVLVTRDITIEERMAQLARANAIHIEDVYEAIGLLKRWQVTMVRYYGVGYPGALDCLEDDTNTFLAKMSGPPR